ncbi:MAG: imidazole glycerol phosphate synthase subunit HisF [Deltaproteobacteria bacterium]|nr:imidazole glycerol phosphate synthase subunit HisF [Deltaproteobacteria bacterium]
MKNRRIIARLDIKGPNLVKGIQFDGNRALGLSEDFAYLYYQEGADEMIFYDTVASLYRRNNLIEFVTAVSKHIFVPLTVSGGIRNVEDVQKILRAGADKVAINTAAIANTSLIKISAEAFGSQCVLAGIEAKRKENGDYEAWVDYGREPTGVNVVEWAQRVVDFGAGEILLTSIDREGTGNGYDLELTARVAQSVPVPVIASGGAGRKSHVLDVIHEGRADAVAVASMFHYYYAKPLQRMYSSTNADGLRLGAQIDEGNLEFLNARYGGILERRFDPISVKGLKSFLAGSGIQCRNM